MGRNFFWLGWQDLNLRMPESKSGALTAWRHPKKQWGGRRESNSRPPGPQSGALTNWATPAIMVRLERFEPPTHGLEGRCSILLSYRRIKQKFSNSAIDFFVERVMGIGPTRPAWKAGVLPLNYTRVCVFTTQRLSILTNKQIKVKRFQCSFEISLHRSFNQTAFI